jgi:LmbE family N-acetylglucosaminyl deacetylase
MRFVRTSVLAVVWTALGAASVFVPASAQQPAPQYRIQPLSDLTGAPGLLLALRRLGTVGTLMQATAHPDDEPNAVLTLYARHLGMRVALVTATRGDGGQNEIGTELFDALGVLRTEELLAAHRFDGAEQYFTRAVDFGYSFSNEETLQKWGRQEILGDYVRHIRTIRPDVIVTMSPEGMGGGQHHQTSAIIAAEAFRAAADPAQFPEQIRDGLRPWQIKKLYRPLGGFGGRGGRGGPPPQGGRGGGRGAPAPAPAPTDATVATLDTNIYEPLLGCTIGEAGSIASGMHMCQGRVPMVPQPGAGGGSRYRLADSVPSRPIAAETSLFDGIDTSLPSLAAYAGDRAPAPLTEGLASINARVKSAIAALDTRGPEAAGTDVAAALTGIRELLGRLNAMGLPDSVRYEIETRLKLKETQAQAALLLAYGVRFDATANDGLIVPGQTLGVSFVVANRGGAEVAVRSVAPAGFEPGGSCPAGSASGTAPYRCDTEVQVGAGARLTDVYWQRPEDAGRATFDADAPFGLPFRPTPFRVNVELDVKGVRVVREVPIQYRYEGAGLVGEKRMELQVVPAFAAGVSPRIVVVPIRTAARAGSAAPSRELRVTVVNSNRRAATATVTIKTPAGWRVSPAAAPIEFSREDESITTRFTITPPATAVAGSSEVTAEVSGAGIQPSASGYQVVEYPHIQRRHKIIPASATVKLIDLGVSPSLSVGYIMGVGDQVPSALQQLGARVTMIDADEMAWGDLSKYHTIVTGVRAYERRADLRANNHRLLKYVENGGTVVVQYNRTEFNQAQYGPYKAVVSSDRITDEHAAVKVLQPSHPVFTYPNRIGARDWENWVQERGTYFLGDRDPKYVDLVEMQDPFENNPGVKRGALVEARYGKGRWLYVGLVLWRQLPSGTEGAYRLFANLISLGKLPASAKPLAIEK